MTNFERLATLSPEEMARELVAMQLRVLRGEEPEEVVRRREAIWRAYLAQEYKGGMVLP